MTIYKRMAELTQYEADAHSVFKIHNLPNAILDRSNSPTDNCPRMPVTGRIEPCRAGCWQGGECTPYNGLYMETPPERGTYFGL